MCDVPLRWGCRCGHTGGRTMLCKEHRHGLHLSHYQTRETYSKTKLFSFVTIEHLMEYCGKCRGCFGRTFNPNHPWSPLVLHDDLNLYSSPCKINLQVLSDWCKCNEIHTSKKKKKVIITPHHIKIRFSWADSQMNYTQIQQIKK